MNDTILRIENFAKETCSVEAHGFSHVDRVRKWAKKIALAEGFPDLEMIEAAALLHDIGRGQAAKQREHGEVGAIMAEKFLIANDLFDNAKTVEICNAIRYHNKNREGTGKLLEIIRDADMLDLMGAVGIMRAFMSSGNKPEFDPDNIKGETWGMTASDFDKRFDSGGVVWKYSMDHINFQISCFDNLKTDTARMIANPLVAYMKSFIKQLEQEVISSNLPNIEI